MNQKELAEWFRVTPRQIQNYVSDGIFPRPKGKAGYDVRECALALIDHRTRGANKRQPDPSEIANTELQAAIEREKLEKLRIENAKAKGEWAPRVVLEHYAAQLGATTHEGLNGLPANIRKRCPHFRAADITLIKQECAKLANAIVNFDPDHTRAA